MSKQSTNAKRESHIAIPVCIVEKNHKFLRSAG